MTETRASTHFASNGPAGDGEIVCDVCSHATEEGHTHRQCYEAGTEDGHRDGFIDCAQLLCTALGREFDGEDFFSLLDEVRVLTGAAPLSASAPALSVFTDGLTALAQRTGYIVVGCGGCGCCASRECPAVASLPPDVTVRAVVHASQLKYLRGGVEIKSNDVDYQGHVRIPGPTT